MLVVPRLLWASLIALRFLLLSSALTKLVRLSSVRVMLLSRNRSSLSRSLLDVLSPGFLVLLVVFSWIRGYYGSVVVQLQWWTTHVVASGVVGLGKYGKCIMQCGFKFGL